MASYFSTFKIIPSNFLKLFLFPRNNAKQNSDSDCNVTGQRKTWKSVEPSGTKWLLNKLASINTNTEVGIVNTIPERMRIKSFLLWIWNFCGMGKYQGLWGVLGKPSGKQLPGRRGTKGKTYCGGGRGCAYFQEPHIFFDEHHHLLIFKSYYN